jgi:hypothetical protein
MRASVERVISVVFLLTTVAACDLDAPERTRAERDPIVAPPLPPPPPPPPPPPLPLDATVGTPVDSGSGVPIIDAGTIIDAAIVDAALTCDSGLDCGPVDSDFELCDGDGGVSDGGVSDGGVSDGGVSADAMLADEIGAADYGSACRAKRCPDDLNDSDKHLYEFCIAAVPISALKTGCQGLVQPWKYICGKVIGGGVAKACCNAVVDTEVPPAWLCTQIYQDTGTWAQCTQCCERMFKANGPLEDYRVRCNTRCARIVN